MSSLSDEDARVAQIVGAGLLACGLVAAIAVPLVFPSTRSIGSVTEQNAVFWTPRGLLGREGSSPVFGVAWGLVYASQAYLAIALLIAASQASIVPDPIGLCNACACTFAATILSAFWTPLFTIAKPWTFAVSAAVLALCAVFATVGVIAAKPFFQGVAWLDAGLAVLSVFSGWAITAATLSIAITTRVYDRGVAGDGREEFSFLPVATAIVVAALAIVFANPVLPAPLLAATLFMPIRKLSIWAASVVCAAGVVLGGSMLLVVYETPFW